MTDYTPTTEEIRYRLILGADPHDLNAAEREELEEFDHWHEEEIRKAKEEAYDEGHEDGWDTGIDAYRFGEMSHGKVNPYRKEQND